MKRTNKTDRNGTRYMKLCRNTCIVPVCSIDSSIHGRSLSQELFAGHAVTVLASKMESCPVMSPIKGTVNMDPKTLVTLYSGIFDNIAKSGYRKIVVYYCGDNPIMLDYFSEYFGLCSGKTYTLYHIESFFTKEAIASEDDVADAQQARQPSKVFKEEAARIAAIVKLVKSR